MVYEPSYTKDVPVPRIWLDGNLSSVMLEHVNWIMSTGIIAHATGGKIYAKLRTVLRKTSLSWEK